MKNISFSFSLNKVIWFLIASDLTLFGAWGFLAPIFAIFVVGQIEGGDASVAGLAIGLYWIAKSLVQPFFARHLDKNHGEIDDFYFLVAGLFVSGLIPLGYLFVAQPIQLYALEIAHAVAMAAVVPTWSGIFTRHIDKGSEAFDWSINSTALGFAAGVAGILGGVLAGTFGFPVVFVLVSGFTMLSAIVLFPIRPLIIPKKEEAIPSRSVRKKLRFPEQKGSL